MAARRPVYMCVCVNLTTGSEGAVCDIFELYKLAHVPPHLGSCLPELKLVRRAHPCTRPLCTPQGAHHPRQTRSELSSPPGLKNKAHELVITLKRSSKKLDSRGFSEILTTSAKVRTCPSRTFGHSRMFSDILGHVRMSESPARTCPKSEGPARTCPKPSVRLGPF